MTGWLFGFVMPVAAAFATVRAALPRGSAATILAAGLAAGCGLGASGALFVVWRFATPASWMSVLPVVDALFWTLGLTLGLIAWRRRRQAQVGRDRLPMPTGVRPGHVLLVIAIVVLAGVSLRYFVLNTARLPHGEWDAWAVWNLKARFLLRGAEDWTALFSPALPHPGYPLMLPGTVARLWMWLGTETPATGAWVAATFTYATPVVAAGAVAVLRGWGPALWTCLLVLAAAPLTIVGAYQIADVPLAFYIIATVALVSLDHGDGNNWLLAALGGLTLGLAGLTKDEGLPFLLGMTACYLAYQIADRHGHARLLRTFALIAATLPAWFVLARIRSAAPSVGLSQAFFDPAAVSKMTDAGRHLEIVTGFARSVWHWAGNGRAGVAPILGAALLLGGYRLEGHRRVAVAFGVATLAIMLGSYYAAFVVTPYDLTWHLTSLDRVLLQVWPTFVWVVCLGAADRPPLRRS